MRRRSTCRRRCATSAIRAGCSVRRGRTRGRLTRLDSDMEDYVAPEAFRVRTCKADTSLSSTASGTVHRKARGRQRLRRHRSLRATTTIFDTAHLSGGDDPTGTITFRLYGPNDAGLLAGSGVRVEFGRCRQRGLHVRDVHPDRCRDISLARGVLGRPEQPGGRPDRLRRAHRDGGRREGHSESVLDGVRNGAVAARSPGRWWSRTSPRAYGGAADADLRHRQPRRWPVPDRHAALQAVRAQRLRIARAIRSSRPTYTSRPAACITPTRSRPRERVRIAGR